MSQDVIDLNEFMERVQDDKELLLELLDIFSDDSQEKMKNLKVAIQQNDYETVKSIAHSLKGASGNISAKALRQSLMKLEEMGKVNDLGQAPALYQEMEVQLADLFKRIEEIKQEFH